MDYTYSLIDKIFRYSLGETGDFSGAMYGGEDGLPLEEAQRRKHAFIAEHLEIGRDTRVLDMGCGWGGFLKFLEQRGAEGVGVTLSEGQQRACRKNGLQVHLRDCRTLQPEDLGRFDAAVCIGAFEAFCSREEWQAGRQDCVYRNFFETTARLMKPRGRFYMQTMVLGKKTVDPAEVDIHAPRNSDAHICAVLQKQFPGHWLPSGETQVVDNARPFFRLLYRSSGRLDYIETQRQWSRAFKKFGLRKYLLYLSLVPRYLARPEFRRRVGLFDVAANRICFEREILDHSRLVFEKL
jgi:cyclopropane-fatty-acyl-phospholipid synthase